MKTLIILIFLSSNFVFSQLDKTKEVNDSKLLSTNLSPIKIGGFREEIKLYKKSLDTIKIWYNNQNLAKLITISNSKNGIDSNYFHNLSSYLNIGFNLTNSLKANKKDFFYDSKLKRLIVKNYDSQDKTKLIRVEFISDYALITAKLPEVTNW